MDARSPLWQTALSALGLLVLILAIGMLDAAFVGSSIRWSAAHAPIAIYGFILPGLAFYHVDAVKRFAGGEISWKAGQALGSTFLGGALLLALGDIWDAGVISGAAGLVARTAMLVGAGLYVAAILQARPMAPLVDVERDPLTKGDDASFKHIIFGHVILMVALSLYWAEAFGSMWGLAAAPRVALAAAHLLLAGFGLLSLYAIGHLLVPRFSGVPAIAAGAIKGELHSSLLGLVGLTVAFLSGYATPYGRGLMVGLGPFVFLGFFVYMGVLGANIMRNKSRTHRVTPEFVYIPWTFSAIFWLVSGVLMGLFLNAAPVALGDQFGALRATHVHIALFGGFLQMWLGWLTRLLPLDAGTAPPRFEGAMRWSFFALNASVLLAVWSHFVAGPSWHAPAAAALFALALLTFALPMRNFMATPEASPA